MNPLAIAIIANVVLGVVLLGLLYRKRGDDTERLTEPGQALDRYRMVHPTARGGASLAADGRAALIDLADGSLGLVERRGRRWNARALNPGEIAGVDDANDGAITIRFADFGWPKARVLLADPVDRRRWIDRLAALRGAAVSTRDKRVHHA